MQGREWNCCGVLGIFKLNVPKKQIPGFQIFEFLIFKFTSLKCTIVNFPNFIFQMPMKSSKSHVSKCQVSHLSFFACPTKTTFEFQSSHFQILNVTIVNFPDFQISEIHLFKNNVHNVCKFKVPNFKKWYTQFPKFAIC